MARDPLNELAFFRLGMAYSGAGRLEEALGALRTTMRLANLLGTPVFGLTLVAAGEPEAAREIFLALPDEMEARRHQGMALVHAALGRESDSDQALARLIACCERSFSLDIAWVHAARGDADAAFAWLEKAAEYGDAGLAQIHGVRAFDALRDDPRWIPFLEHLGLAPAQLDEIELEIPPLGGDAARGADRL